MDETVWHMGDIKLPRRGIDGSWCFGRVWLRKTPKGWEYQPRAETEDEYWQRHW